MGRAWSAGLAVTAAVVGIVIGIATAVKGVWNISKSTTTLVNAVTANTAATVALSAELSSYRAETQNTLTEHGERLARLESSR